MITKTTVNMAARRGIAIEFWNGHDMVQSFQEADAVQFCYITNGEAWDEYHARYAIQDGELFFTGGCFDTEEWPYWIETEAQLRGLLNAMAVEMAK